MRNLWTAEEALFRLNIANLAATDPVSVADERQLIELMENLRNILASRARRMEIITEELDFAEFIDKVRFKR